jgi:hypothetical protein
VLLAEIAGAFSLETLQKRYFSSSRTLEAVGYVVPDNDLEN